MYGWDILCGISKGTFEIPHTISYPYIEKCAFHSQVKIEEPLNLRVHKCFWNAAQGLGLEVPMPPPYLCGLGLGVLVRPRLRCTLSGLPGLLPCWLEGSEEGVLLMRRTLGESAPEPGGDAMLAGEDPIRRMLGESP